MSAVRYVEQTPRYGRFFLLITMLLAISGGCMRRESAPEDIASRLEQSLSTYLLQQAIREPELRLRPQTITLLDGLSNALDKIDDEDGAQATRTELQLLRDDVENLGRNPRGEQLRSPDAAKAYLDGFPAWLRCRSALEGLAQEQQKLTLIQEQLEEFDTKVRGLT